MATSIDTELRNDMVAYCPGCGRFVFRLFAGDSGQS